MRRRQFLQQSSDHHAGGEPLMATSAVAVTPAAVLPSGVRYSTLSKETHQQHHLAVGMDGDKYLAVHPIYSLPHRMYVYRVCGALLFVFLEAIAFLLVLVGLVTPCYTIDNHKYVALDGGYGGYLSGSPGRSMSLFLCSLFVIIFLFFFSLACPVLVACCVRRDQRARVYEESFNRELLEEYGAQVHEDGRVYGPGGEPSVVKEESMPGPCCGFEANERSRLSRNAWIACVQFVVEVTSVVLQSIILYNMVWVYHVAVEHDLTAKYESGFYITIVALTFKALEVLFYGYAAFRVLCIVPQRRTPPCELLPMFTTDEAHNTRGDEPRYGAAATTAATTVEEGHITRGRSEQELLSKSEAAR
ncbi:hypothetical protein NESM_000526900 [Novymonas esmeraldas]|uniref:Uncharacterized protein n=1 Tax=Novymonas esmeraldas TaxID=1808958 RepID=A0AAW0EPG6_9TRYP